MTETSLYVSSISVIDCKYTGVKLNHEEYFTY